MNKNSDLMNTYIEPCFRSKDEAAEAVADNGKMRHFAGGATRDLDDRKLDFDGFFSPKALKAFAHYMNMHRQTAAGLRDSDNWQAGFPEEVLMKSMWRHFFDLWTWHRAAGNEEDPLASMCGVMFNLQCYMKQLLDRDPDALRRMGDYIARERAKRQPPEEV